MMENPFKPYENIHLGESCILFGCGPSIEKYDASLADSNILKVGLNESIYLDLDLDYWFMGDAFPRDPNKFLNHFDDYNNYKPRLQKFIRHPTWNCPGALPKNMKYAKYYPCDLDDVPAWIECKIKKDISMAPLWSGATIAFEALQFVLYSGIKKIYLVGHDCDYSNGTFRTKFHGSQGSGLIECWACTKEWVNINYPDVSFFSVNPVALKIFEEVRNDEIRN